MRCILGVLLLCSATLAVRAAQPDLRTTTSLLQVILTTETRTAVLCPAGAQSDLWLLAGQSNMQGFGLIPQPDVAANEGQGLPEIWNFDMSNAWVPARDPLHRLYAAKAPAHRLINRWTPEKQAAIWYRENHYPPGKIVRGVGPGLPFARAIAQVTGTPVGLIATAHGGTGMRQWSPQAAGTGDETLYGAMMARARLVGADGAGGKLRGLLWYQGENDAFNAGFVTLPDKTTETVERYYTHEFLNFVDSVRRDLKRPDLPIIYAQLARFTMLDPSKVAGWETMRETQRRLMTLRPNLYMVTGEDLPQDDSIHLSAAGQTRLGQRMAKVALRAVYQRPEGVKPLELDRVEVLPSSPRSPITIYTIRVHFKNVNGRLRAEGRPAGFSLRRSGPEGTRLNDLHRIEFDAGDPAVVNLLVQAPWVKDTQLYYGAGIAPYVNIVDEQDMGLPAFGPLALPEPPTTKH